MATTTKSVKKVESKTEPENVNDSKDLENVALKNEVDELKAQIAMLTKLMASGTAPVETKKKDRMIRFYNMVPGNYVLRGTTIWKIEGQFNYRDFTETEANIIFNHMHGAILKGSIYIADAQFIEEHNLEELYRHILSESQMRELLNRDVKYVVECYKMANDAQKQIIVDMFVERKAKGMPVDLNVLTALGELCGKDFLKIETLD